MRYITFALLLLSLGFGITQAYEAGLTNDTGLFMQQALVMWEHPDWMYTRIIQVNASFHMMMYAPLAAFAAHMHFSPARTLHVFAFLICIMSLLSLNHALKRHAVAKDERLLWCTAAAFLLFVTPPLFEVFADREHLLVAFALPWIIQMLLRLQPLPCTAALAALGFCMRPYNIILFAVLSLTGGPKEWSLRQRLFSTSSLIIAAIIGLYALSVIIFFPAWLTTIAPMAALTYSAIQTTPLYKLEMGFPFFILMLAALPGFIKVERITWYSFTVTMICLFMINSGWDYTFYFLVTPLVLIYAAPWCSPFREHIKQVFAVRFVSICLLALLLGICGLYMKDQVISVQKNGSSLRHHHLSAALASDLHLAAENQFILLSTTLWSTDIEPFSDDPRSVFAFDVLWPFHWLLKHPHDRYFPEVLHFVTDSLLQAMQEHPDAAVIVDISPVPSYAADGRILELLEQDARIKAAFNSYVMEKTIAYCNDTIMQSCRFSIWQYSHKK